MNTLKSKKEITKIIARMVYGIQGSDPNQPKMVGLKEASMTLKESLQQAYKKGYRAGRKLTHKKLEAWVTEGIPNPK